MQNIWEDLSASQAAYFYNYKKHKGMVLRDSEYGYAICNLLLYSYCLTLSPTTEKHRPYTGIGLRRPQATTIVAGNLAPCHMNALVPAYEICVSEWGGAPCTQSSFIEMAPGP